MLRCSSFRGASFLERSPEVLDIAALSIFRESEKEDTSMLPKVVTNQSEKHGATVVITHRVAKNKHADYDAWLNEITPLSTSSAGFLDWQIVRPIPEQTETFTIIIRFDTQANLEGWMNSPTRNQLIEKVQALLVSGDDFFVSSGLDFWFTPEGAKAKVPIRWKQYLVTWSAIYPLALGVPLLVLPLLKTLGISNPYLISLVMTGTIVFCMVYVVMPNYTRLIHRWLFK